MWPGLPPSLFCPIFISPWQGSERKAESFPPPLAQEMGQLWGGADPQRPLGWLVGELAIQGGPLKGVDVWKPPKV